MKKLLLLQAAIFASILNLLANGCPAGIPKVIDLSSRFVLPNTLVAETGCSIKTTATVEITNPDKEAYTAKFKLVLKEGMKVLQYRITGFNGYEATEADIPNPNHVFILMRGQRVTVKLEIQFSGTEIQFNKVHILTCTIKPEPGSAFIDNKPVNDQLTREIFIGSPNVLCFRCVETADLPERTQFSFFTPGIDYLLRDCQTFPAFLSGPSPEMKRPATKEETDKQYFEIINNAVFANTTVKKVLIKNLEGKYLTFNNSAVAFMDRIENDTHHYQDWVILKSSINACQDRKYKLVQYLDDNRCFELYQIQVSGKYYLYYRTGISAEKEGEKILIKPRYELSGNNDGNRKL